MYVPPHILLYWQKKSSSSVFYPCIVTRLLVLRDRIEPLLLYIYIIQFEIGSIKTGAYLYKWSVINLIQMDLWQSDHKNLPSSWAWERTDRQIQLSPTGDLIGGYELGRSSHDRVPKLTRSRDRWWQE